MNKKNLTTLLFLLLSINDSYAIKGLTEKEIAIEQEKELKFKEEYFKYHEKHGFDYGLLKPKYTKKEFEDMLKNQPLQKNK
jgi:hypothetical protein